MKFNAVVVIFGALLLAACASGPALQPGPHLTLVDAQELPSPLGARGALDDGAFRIGPLDQIDVSVFGMPELSQEIQVDASGHFSLPLVGAIDASGRTPDEVASQIEANLRSRYVRNPQVAVNMRETVSRVLTIDGQVEEPGIYPVVGRMTLMRAVAQAKGATEFARLQDVVIFRTVGDREMVALYNLQAIRRGTYPDPKVFANDVIVVGDSPGRRLFRDVLQASPILVGPLIALLQR